MAAQRKREEPAAVPPNEAEPSRSVPSPVRADNAATPSPSPARQLQADLEQQMRRPYPDLSPRQVTATVIIVCLAFWWGVYMLAASLL